MRYDRAVLAEVVVYHHKVSIEGCLCGWAELGVSIGQHVADEYERLVRETFYECCGADRVSGHARSCPERASLMARLGVTEDEVHE